MDLDRVLGMNRDYSPRTPHHVIKDFMSGTLHEDFRNEIAVRIEAMRDYLETCGSKEYLAAQGGIAALRLVEKIFDDLYNNGLSDQTRDESSITGDV